MEILSWSAAFAIVGSVLGVCLTVLKILAMRKDKPLNGNASLWTAMKEHDKKCEHLAERVSVIEAQLLDMEKDTDRQEEQLNKLNDLIIRLLTGEDS